MPWNDARSDVYERAEGDIEPLPQPSRLLRTSNRSTPGRRSYKTVARESRDPRRPTAPGSNGGRAVRFCSPGTACSKLAVHRRLFEQNCCERGPPKSSHVKPIYICIQTCTPSSSNCGFAPHDVKHFFFLHYISSPCSGLSLVAKYIAQFRHGPSSFT